MAKSEKFSAQIKLNLPSDLVGNCHEEILAQAQVLAGCVSKVLRTIVRISDIPLEDILIVSKVEGDGYELLTIRQN